ncbi:MAG TPA: hypothetical protein VIL35_11905 [Vicinamibacterales bacterium]
MAKKSTAAVKATRTSKATPKAATASPKKHVGDVLGISRARVPADVPRPAMKKGGGRPKGIELPRSSRTGTARARVVGGVRGRGR